MSRMTDDKCQEALAAYDEAGSYNAGARLIGWDRMTFKRHVKEAHRRGLQLSEGIKGILDRSKISPVEAKGGWIAVFDDNGQKIGNTRWAATDLAPEIMAERVRAVFDDMPAAPAIIKSEKSPEGKFKLIPDTDVHMGAVVDEDRAGNVYNPDIAMQRLQNGFSECFSALPQTYMTVILSNGDMTHANDDRDATPRSGHRLKVQGTHRDNVDLCVISTIWRIDLALQGSDLVVYRINKGNHDPNTPDYMYLALKAYYRDEPRVIIEADQRATWVFQRGRVFISAHHGDGIKPQKFFSHIPGKFSKQWGDSDHWYGFTGHLHEFKREKVGALLWTQLPSICPLEQHADDMGFSDDSAMHGMLFDERAGLKNEITVRF